MKKLFTYTVLLSGLSAALFSCTKQEEWEPTGNRLEINAELVSSSEWTTRAADERVEYGHWAEMGGGEYIITAQKEDWNAHRPAPEAPEAPDAPASTAPEAPDAPLTRGTPITSVSGITKMQVNIFQTASADWTTSSLRTAALTATRSGTGYTVSPSYNWPMDASAKTTLFAYSPQTSSSNGLSENGANKINYTVPTAVANQPDLCTAAPKMNVINSDGTQQIQSFALSHQLTAVGFTMLGWKLKITKITVSGVNTVGTLTMNTNGTTSWASSFPDSRDVGVTQSSYTHNHDSDYADITTSNGYLMMIPQTLTDAATVTITYASTGTGADSGTVTAKLKDLGVTWEAGDKITYNIRLKTAPAVTSGDMTITTHKWGYTTSSPLTVFGEGTDRLTFTWDASWLKIHHGSALNGNPPTGYGAVSPWSINVSAVTSSRSLYFFATNDHTSFTGDRTATITVKGTRSGTKTFVVRQVKNTVPTLTLSATAPGETVPARGKTYTINVVSNTDWTASALTNVTLSKSSGVAGTTAVTVTVGVTAASTTRAVSVKFTTNVIPGGATATQTWAGTQAAVPPYVVINGVKWQLSNFANSVNWDTAMTLCKSPWRLPSRTDFNNLINSGKISQVTGISSGYYWSSTVYNNTYRYCLGDGYKVVGAAKYVNYPIRCCQ